MIGAGVSLLLLFNGRIAGISGILSGTLFAKKGEWQWRVVFLLGMIAGASVYNSLAPNTFAPRANFPLALLVIGGLLVGFGTRLGSGCTSGHGICGLSRRSPRSIVATLVFIGFGVLSVFLIRHVFGLAL